MTFGSIIYTLLIMPLQLFFEVIYQMANKILDNPGLSIVALSLAMNFLVLPLYRKADKMQEEERDIEAKLHDGVKHIKSTFKGDERMMILNTYYRQNGYKPTDVFKGSISLFLEIPFFIAAYQFLSKLEILKGTSFFVINDLGSPDALISVSGLSINILPIIMTLINVISCIIFTKGYPLKTKIQLYGMALFFMVFLYNSPSGLVVYWTLNNLFSLVKTIFYKLKNPKKILLILFSLVGLMALSYGLFLYHTSSTLRKLFVIGFGALLFIVPILIMIFDKNRKERIFKLEPNRKRFVFTSIYLVILIGLIIPSQVIKSSPQEFVDLENFLHPIWYIVSSFLYASGLFLIWIRVFYWLSSKKAKVFFEGILFILCGVFTVDYMLFGKDLGLLTNALKFENGLEFSRKEQLINIAAVIVVFIVFLLLFKIINKHITTVVSILCFALVIMVGMNVVDINKSISTIKNDTNYEDTSLPSFELSKEGNNVIVIMLDRAMNGYVPFILNEKPELKDSFSGFTYYDNVLSFGGHTNFAAPALFGGYEYTPDEMNKRDKELLVDKHNESLLMMPVLFDQNGYDVTVCDAPYANYEWIPDLSIYDEYENIDTYHTSGRFQNSENKVKLIKENKRNFFCYSFMKVFPLIVQDLFYDHGRYNNPDADSSQTIFSIYEAEGEDTDFNNAYYVLENFSNMTKIVDGNKDTFMMINNDTAHDHALLKLPEYEPAKVIDNTEYEKANYSRFTLDDGRSLSMSSINQYTAYQSNMASLIKLAAWLDYLKANNVYDNTRIIIVADHGDCAYQIESMVLDDGSDVIYDTEYYYPLLMVKDFNSTEFSISDNFMTNADVPTLAISGIIENAKNPFTGKIISSEDKLQKDMLVLASENWSVYVNCGTTFEPGTWLTVHDDVRNIENWSIYSR